MHRIRVILISWVGIDHPVYIFFQRTAETGCLLQAEGECIMCIYEYRLEEETGDSLFLDYRFFLQYDSFLHFMPPSERHVQVNFLNNF